MGDIGEGGGRGNWKISSLPLPATTFGGREGFQVEENAGGNDEPSRGAKNVCSGEQ